MKNIYLVVPALFLSVFASAKGSSQSTTTGGIGGSGGFPHFNSQQSSNNNPKISLRLVGKTFCKFGNGQFTPVDSTSYQFKTDRGGVINPDDPNNDETVLYDESYTYLYSNGYIPQMHRVQGYNGNKVTSLAFEPWDRSKQDFEDSSKYVYTYADGKMIKSTFLQWYGGMWTKPIESDIVYVNDKVTELNGFNYKAAFNYDVNNQLTTVIDAEFSSLGWTNKERNTYTYVDNQVATRTRDQWDAASNSWLKVKLWQYAYSNSKLVTTLESDWNGSSWVNRERHVYDYDNNGNKTSDVGSMWSIASGSFENAKKLTYEYNDQDLSETITEQSWNGSSWYSENGDVQYRYYYQNYFPSSVKGISALSSNLKLYPVPTANVLNIDLRLEQTETLAISIFDIRGIAVFTLSEKASNTYHKQVDVSQLPVGNYVLRIKGDKSDFAERFVVAK